MAVSDKILDLNPVMQQLYLVKFFHWPTSFSNRMNSVTPCLRTVAGLDAVWVKVWGTYKQPLLSDNLIIQRTSCFWTHQVSWEVNWQPKGDWKVDILSAGPLSGRVCLKIWKESLLSKKSRGQRPVNVSAAVRFQQAGVHLYWSQNHIYLRPLIRQPRWNS